MASASSRSLIRVSSASDGSRSSFGKVGRLGARLGSSIRRVTSQMVSKTRADISYSPVLRKSPANLGLTTCYGVKGDPNIPLLMADCSKPSSTLPFVLQTVSSPSPHTSISRSNPQGHLFMLSVLLFVDLTKANKHCLNQTENCPSVRRGFVPT